MRGKLRHFASFGYPVIRFNEARALCAGSLPLLVLQTNAASGFNEARALYAGSCTTINSQFSNAFLLQ